MNSKQEQFTPRNESNTVYQTGDYSQQIGTHSLSQRNSLLGNSNQMNVPIKSIPISDENQKSRINPFSMRNFSTQECIPWSTSSDLSKTLKNIWKARVNSPENSAQNLISRKMSMNTLCTAANGYENQSITSWNHAYCNDTELSKKYKHKSKRYHRRWK